jgi:ABC transporter substrate binding protein
VQQVSQVLPGLTRIRCTPNSERIIRPRGRQTSVQAPRSGLERLVSASQRALRLKLASGVRERSRSSRVSTPEKHLQLLKELVPRLSRVAILWNPNNPIHAAHVRGAEAVAQKLGLHPQSLEARDPKDFDGVFSVIGRGRAQAPVVLANAQLFLGHRGVIAYHAARNRLPAIYPRREHVEAGGLIAYGADRRELFRRLAVYVDRILKGAKPTDLPVEQPTKFELAINLKTAKALGLTIPPSLLLRADQGNRVVSGPLSRPNTSKTRPKRRRG